MEKIDSSQTIVEFYSRSEDKFRLFYGKLQDLCNVLGVDITVVESPYWKKIPKELRARGVLGLQRQIPQGSRSGLLSSSSPTRNNEKEVSRPLSSEVSTSPKFCKQFTETVWPTTPKGPRKLENIHWMPMPSLADGKEINILESANVRDLRDFMKAIEYDLVSEIKGYCRINAKTTRAIPNTESMLMIKCITYEDAINKQEVSVNDLHDLIFYMKRHSQSPLRIEWHKDKPTKAEFLYLGCD